MLIPQRSFCFGYRKPSQTECAYMIHFTCVSLLAYAGYMLVAYVIIKMVACGMEAWPFTTPGHADSVY